MTQRTYSYLYLPKIIIKIMIQFPVQTTHSRTINQKFPFSMNSRQNKKCSNVCLKKSIIMFYQDYFKQFDVTSRSNKSTKAADSVANISNNLDRGGPVGVDNRQNFGYYLSVKKRLKINDFSQEIHTFCCQLLYLLQETQTMRTCINPPTRLVKVSMYVTPPLGVISRSGRVCCHHP